MAEHQKSLAEQIEAQYNRRSEPRSPRPAVSRVLRSERLRVCQDFLRHLEPLADRTLLEIGAHHGANVPYFLDWGFRPDRVVLNDIRPALNAARSTLPAGIRIMIGDGAQLPVELFDVVYVGLVFSSIVSPFERLRVAAGIWRLVKPGGGILWYDFTWNNPWNRDVRGVSLDEVGELFPAARLASRRVTLAPPISRRTPLWLYRVLNRCPLLKTHRVCWLQKDSH
jgi:SAM-dependent methyltransferase